MRVELLNDRDYIRANNLQPITNPITFYGQSDPTPDGLLSTEIFGIKASERKEIPAYIPLNGHYLSPSVYKLLIRLNRKFRTLINGNKKYSIIDGDIVEDDNGGTGLEFLYKNWDKIKFKKTDSLARGEKIDLLTMNKRDDIFIQNLIIIPAFYRDVNLRSKSSGRIAPHEINLMYNKIIRLSNMLLSSNYFDFTLISVRASIQETIVEIYDYFTEKLTNKGGGKGIIRNSLMGKNIDYGVRTIITAPIMKGNTHNDIRVTYEYTGVPIQQVCTLFAPFVIHWVREFFRRELSPTMGIPALDESEPFQLDDPHGYFNEEYIENIMAEFVRSHSSRFNRVMVPITKETQKNKKLKEPFIPIRFTGRMFDSNSPNEKSSISHRDMTWMDVFYRAAYEVTQGKHIILTRYPFTDVFSSVITRITVLTTYKTEPVYIGETLYKHYPVVEIGLSDTQLSTRFFDTLSMSNTYLKGLGGDYDGDQVSVRGVFSQEANEEAEKIMHSTKSLLDISGNLMRTTTNECIQTLFNLTKD